MVTCSECGKSVKPEWDECPYCEAALQKFCPECGEEIDPQMRKCPNCKTRLQGTDADTEATSGAERVAAPTGPAPGQPPPSGARSVQGIGDVGMIKDSNVNVQQHEEHIHYEDRPKQAVTTTELCPVCKAYRKEGWFRCDRCRLPGICEKHRVEGTNLCEPCDQKIQEEEQARKRAQDEELARTGNIQLGMVIGERYEIAEFLGEGGMGRVFLARDLVDRQPCALKFLPPEMSRDEEALENLRKEMRVAMELTSPNIVRLYHLESIQRLQFLKMEYVEGSTLGQLLRERKKQGKTFTMKELDPILAQIGKALDTIHGEGVVHRDLKPGNVMVTVRGVVKIMDLGIARVIRDSVSKVSLKSITGTPAYMSPEQIHGKGQIDGRSDQYSLACMVYELLSGEPPFHTGEIPYQHLYTEPEPLDGVDPWVSEALLKALAKDREQRFQRAGEFCEELTGEPARKREAAREKEAAEARAREAAQRAAEEKAKAEEEARQAAEAKARREAEERARREAEERARREAERKKREEEARQAAEAKAKREREEAERRKRKPKVYTQWPFEAREAKGRQQETAEALGLPVETEVDLGRGAKMAFVLIPAGEFLMGSPEEEEKRGDDETQHKVTLSRPFYVGKYQVTQTQWEAVTGENPSHFKGEQNPVEKVSWDDCQEFIKKLNARVGSARLSAFSGASEERAEARTTSLDFALPTEAQWEYACRAGTETPFHTGQTLSTDEANYDGNFPYRAGAKGESRKETISVGTLAGNAWGLYDMHGNVWGWCQDWYRNYPDGEVVDPTGPEEGSLRVRRGGSWGNDARDCRSACRHWHTPDYRNDNLGCRLLLRSNP